MVVASDEKSQCFALLESASQPSGTWIPLPSFALLNLPVNRITLHTTSPTEPFTKKPLSDDLAALYTKSANVL
jgi:hypothetical protein